MQAIEFQTTIKEIISAIPQDKRDELGGYTENESVRVIVLASPPAKSQKRKDLLRDAKDKGYDDFFEYLMDNPIDISHPIRYTKDEIHER